MGFHSSDSGWDFLDCSPVEKDEQSKKIEDEEERLRQLTRKEQVRLFDKIISTKEIKKIKHEAFSKSIFHPTRREWIQAGKIENYHSFHNYTGVKELKAILYVAKKVLISTDKDGQERYYIPKFFYDWGTLKSKRFKKEEIFLIKEFYNVENFMKFVELDKDPFYYGNHLYKTFKPS